MNGIVLNSIALGQRIRYYRKEKGMTQEQLAETIGISLSFLGHIERGSRIMSVETLIRFATFFNVSIDDLLQDSLPMTATARSAREGELFRSIKVAMQKYADDL